VTAIWRSRTLSVAVCCVLALGGGSVGRAALAARAAGSSAWSIVTGPAHAGRVVDAASGSRPVESDSAVASVGIRVGHARSDGGYDVRTYELEDYVAHVLAGEAASRTGSAALEALAITVRTFALANRTRHRRVGFDLCDLTHCQVLREPYPAARAAAAATAGLVLLWHGQPASVYYTASCGGRSERPSDVWPGADDPPFLRSRRDTACDGEPRWVTEIPVVDLERALTAAGYRGAGVRDVRIAERSESGRVTRLVLRGLTPDAISGQRFRMAVGRTLGWQLIRSTDFDVKRNGAGYRFSGRGFGHGVGLCVIGAARRAASGASRTELLKTYFPGLPVARLR
jgi:stage II sporulation protein D